MAPFSAVLNGNGCNTGVDRAVYFCFRPCSPLSYIERIQLQHRYGPVLRGPQRKWLQHWCGYGRAFAGKMGREALHYLSVTIADSFLRSHGLERYMRLSQCPPPPPFAAVRAKFQGEFLDSSVDFDVDRLALLCSCAHGLIVSDCVASAR